MKEGFRAKSSFFITFTYDTDHVPITNNGFMSLKKSDFQKFIKRLRKVHSGKKIVYFNVGEYGGKTNRPHYHAIMFNVDIDKVEKCWNLGFIHVGQVAEASIGYTLKYMMKESKIPMHKNDDRVPEFQHMSKGIGSNYLTPAMLKWHGADLENRMYCSIDGGKKIAMPRYYKNKIYTEEQRRLIGASMVVDTFYLQPEEKAINIEYSNRKIKKARLNEGL